MYMYNFQNYSKQTYTQKQNNAPNNIHESKTIIAHTQDKTHPKQTNINCTHKIIHTTPSTKPKHKHGTTHQTKKKAKTITNTIDTIIHT